MTKKDEELKKKDAIVLAKQIISMPKYKVVGHQTTPLLQVWNGQRFDGKIEDVPKEATDILVIYLKK
jgi:hypothetical protein